MAKALAAALAAVAAVIALAAYTRYPGSGAVFLFFNLCYFAMAALALPAPRLYVYTFLAFFFAMGCWAKTILHTLSPRDFLEPVGDFRNLPEQWDAALLAMSAAALAFVAVRLAHLRFARGRGRPQSPAAVPPWFARHRLAVWILTGAGLLGVCVANLHFAFYQIGVNPRLLLPLRGHVLVAWLINVGFALWVATLLWWDYRHAPHALGRNLVAALGEAFLTSVSAFSRSLYIVHATPYWLALWERRSEFRSVLSRRHVVAFAAAFVVIFAAAIVTVFALRLELYPLVDRTTGQRGDASIAKNVAHDLPQLVLQRWVGLEGALTAASASDRGTALAWAGVTDSPKGATQSLYQRIAKFTPYRVDPSRFTFLTNAGPIAIFLLSGSAVIVFAGMALVAAILCLTEEFAMAASSNPFLVALSGAAIANVVSQTTFFYLTLIFLLQLWLALALLALAQRRFSAPR